MRYTPLCLLFGLLAWAADAPFVPADFAVPKTYQTARYTLKPLGPGLEKLDYDAYMGSVDHIRTTFGSGRWPRPGITMEEALKDVQGEEKRFNARQSFTYAVLSPDGQRELGCVYIQPARKQGYDAQVTMWVIKDQADQKLNQELHRDVKAWLAKDWPFQKVAWPRTEIPMEQWNALPAKASTK